MSHGIHVLYGYLYGCYLGSLIRFFCLNHLMPNAGLWYET